MSRRLFGNFLRKVIPITLGIIGFLWGIWASGVRDLNLLGGYLICLVPFTMIMFGVFANLFFKQLNLSVQPGGRGAIYFTTSLALFAICWLLSGGVRPEWGPPESAHITLFILLLTPSLVAAKLGMDGIIRPEDVS